MMYGDASSTVMDAGRPASAGTTAPPAALAFSTPASDAMQAGSEKSGASSSVPLANVRVAPPLLAYGSRMGPMSGELR